MRAEMGKDPSRAPPSQLSLPPGFRFYPTDEELVVHYLCKKAASEPFGVPIIAEVELYKFDPWDLPERALFGEKEWYFFSPRDRKYPNGSRPNRAAGAGYWKATGTDKPISTMGGSKKVGVKKALVFYKGKAPKGVKTNWIMHEYRLADSGAKSAKRKGSLRLDDWVLCRIYKKCSSAQKTASTKERSESSCLDDVLATLPEIDNRMNPVNGLQEGAHMGKTVNLNFYQEPAQYSAGNSSDLTTTYMQQLQGKMAGMAAAMKFGYINREVNDQGASSLELSSHPDSNGFSSRQHSSPESVQEDDSVESTFNSLPSFPMGQLNVSTAFPQSSFYGLDLGLPSPSMAGPGAFASLVDPDYNNFFPTSDYTNNLHRAFSQPDRSTHLGWDSKVNFS